MSTDSTIWIGQNGEKYGPYSEANVRQWMAEGKFAPDAFAWCEGMPDWVPLSRFFATAANASSRRPPPPPSFRPESGSHSDESFSAQRHGQAPFEATSRNEIPLPPSLHWGLVLFFTMITFGIFGLVWSFIQANWIRKIDSQSKVTWLLVIALICFFIGEPLYLTSLFALHHGSSGLVGLGALLLFARWILYLVAYFSMAKSIERQLASQGLPLAIGRITLFFFPMYYLQAQLSWLARWKSTGQTSPSPSKGTIWAFFLLVPFLIGILAAIAIPAYQSYLIRAQVAEGMVLADGAKLSFTEYYNNHHAVPSDNAAAGLAPDTSIAGKYVSSVDVSDGKITVAFDTVGANVTIRDKVLVLSPNTHGGQITWTCSAESTVPERDLPLTCRH